jgi:hypothetical protein
VLSGAFSGDCHVTSLPAITIVRNPYLSEVSTRPVGAETIAEKQHKKSDEMQKHTSAFPEGKKKSPA